MELELDGTNIPARIRQMRRDEADIAMAWAADCTMCCSLWLFRRESICGGSTDHIEKRRSEKKK